jgi:hypothetical protein
MDSHIWIHIGMDQEAMNFKNILHFISSSIDLLYIAIYICSQELYHCIYIIKNHVNNYYICFFPTINAVLFDFLFCGLCYCGMSHVPLSNFMSISTYDVYNCIIIIYFKF